MAFNLLSLLNAPSISTIAHVRSASWSMPPDGGLEPLIWQPYDEAADSRRATKAIAASDRQTADRANAMRSEDGLGLISRPLTSQGAYVLFARRFARNFYAIVATHQPIPSLLMGPAWRFLCVLKGRSARQEALRSKDALRAMQRDGCYLFCAPPDAFCLRNRRSKTDAR